MVWDTARRASVVPYLEWAINSAAVEHLKDYYLLHGGAVTLDNTGMLLLADSGSGTTTLVAALLMAGCKYLSDDVSVIDPTTGCLLPFAKSLRIRDGSRTVLAPSYPELKAASRYRDGEGEPIWYLRPRTEWLPAAPVPLRRVFLPRYVPNATTTLDHAPRSTVLESFLAQSFNLQRHGASAIGGLARILQNVECFTLTYSDLGAAVSTLIDGAFA